MIVVLRPIQQSDQAQLIEYRQAYERIGETMHGDGGWQKADNFKDWYEGLEDFRQESTVPKGFVPADTYVLDEGGMIIGMTNLRHRLNDYLIKFGGHIGYSIHPDYWGQGYGKLILKLLLPQAKLIGLDKVLVTCNLSNPASAKIIEANGGILDNTIEEDNGEVVCRYWINLN